VQWVAATNPGHDRIVAHALDPERMVDEMG
jgi:hypothetical protein